jgi:Tfp pilus assembly protein PilF
VRHRKRPRQVSGPTLRSAEGSPRSESLAEVLRQAERMLLDARPRDVLDLLVPLAEKHKASASLHLLLGRAYLEVGDALAAAVALERAVASYPDISVRLSLAVAYESLELNVLALREYRRVLKSKPRVPGLEALLEHVETLEGELIEVAQAMDLPVQRTEEGLLYWEQAVLAGYKSEYREAISLSRKAIARLGDWPPAHINLAKNLYLNGQPDESIATLQRVLARHPDDLDARCTAIRCLAWSGRVDEAEALWSRIEHLNPERPLHRVKLAYAAADLNRDADVYRLLSPLTRKRSGEVMPFGWEVYLAVAEANLGRRDVALRRLRRFSKTHPYTTDLVAALVAGKPGPGIAQRFPYVHYYLLLPMPVYDQLFDLMGNRDKMSPRGFQQQLDDLVKRYPQIVLLAEKMIWEMDMVANGIDLLDSIGSPAAFAALKRFAFSQAGSDRHRIAALYALADAGEVPVGQPVRAWLRGEWREITLQALGAREPFRPPYSDQVMALLARAVKCMNDGDDAQAELLFRDVLEIEPQAVEAYNNLAAVYERRKDNVRCHEMLWRALAINPNYVHARGNLAMFMLRDGDVDGAEAFLEPLERLERMDSDEVAFMSYVRAKCLIAREAFADAIVWLDRALAVEPDYKPAEELLEWVEMRQALKAGSWSFWDRMHQRHLAARRRLQQRITHLDPTLQEVLELYSREALTGVSRAVMVSGGWSALKKADLIRVLVANLTEPDTIEFVIHGLQDEDMEALRDVLRQGGVMLWSDFEARYGSDLEESPYWNFHVPDTVMGRLRVRALLAEATVEGTLYVCVPLEMRQPLIAALGVPS